MYAVSEDYKTHIQNSTVRKAYAKIVVDGVTYDGQKIKKYPAITAQGDFIGSFPAKCCTFEIYNIGVDLTGKEIEVYRGLEIGGAVEWVLLGKFTAAADGIKTSSTGDSISYTGYDRATRFDVEYEALSITYPTTIGAFAQELAARRGLDFDTTPFPCCDIILTAAPNIPSGTAEREVIRQIAELGGANAWISREGALCISQPRQTNEQIPKRKYTSLSSKEATFGGINTVVLGNAEYDDDIIYQDAGSVAANGVVEWRLEDNAFAESDRAAFAEYIGDSYIIGLSYTPFEVTGLVDDWYLDLFDVVQIEDKSGAYFSTVILSYSTTDRIKSTIAAGQPEEMHTNYEIAGTVQSKMRYVSLQVDHVNNQIQSIAADVETLGDNVTTMQSSITQTAQAIELKVSKNEIINAINLSDEGIKIDASKLVYGGWLVNESGLYYGSESAPDLYLGTNGITATINGTSRSDLVFKAGDDFAVCADGCLYAASGEFGGNLTGDVCKFKKLEAEEGGTIEVGEWTFQDDGLEYSGGVFDFEYSGGVAKISGTAPMQVGPWANGITNSLMLYGTEIVFGVSSSNYQCVMDSYGKYTQVCFRPTITNTGNIGTSDYHWDTGHFRNLYIYNILTIENLTANSNVTAETINAGSAARVSGTMVIGSSSASQPSRGLLISAGSTSTNLETAGYVKVGAMTAGDSGDTPLRWGASSKRLVTYSSSRRYKENINDLPDELADKVFDLRPVTYNRKESGYFEFGLIAEEVAEVTPLLCTYTTLDDGTRRVEGVNYDILSVLNTRKIQDIYKELEELREEIAKLKGAA